MSTRRPELGCILYAGSYDDRSQAWYAVVSLSDERVRMMIDRVREVSERKKWDRPFQKMSIFDAGGIRFFRLSERVLQMADEEHERHEIYKAIDRVKGSWIGRLIAYPALGTPAELDEDDVGVRWTIMNVYGGALVWEAQDQRTYEKIQTSELSIVDLLLARIYHAPAAEWDGLFRELVGEDPDLALSVLENGLEIVGMDPIEIAPHVTRESLTPLLAEANESYRQRAIALLGRIGE